MSSHLMHIMHLISSSNLNSPHLHLYIPHPISPIFNSKYFAQIWGPCCYTDTIVNKASICDQGPLICGRICLSQSCGSSGRGSLARQQGMARAPSVWRHGTPNRVLLARIRQRLGERLRGWNSSNRYWSSVAWLQPHPLGWVGRCVGCNERGRAWNRHSPWISFHSQHPKHQTWSEMQRWAYLIQWPSQDKCNLGEAPVIEGAMLRIPVPYVRIDINDYFNTLAAAHQFPIHESTAYMLLTPLMLGKCIACNV